MTSTPLKVLAAALFFALAFAALGFGADAPAAFPGALGDVIAPILIGDPKGVDHDITLPENPEGRVGIYFWSVFCGNCKDALPSVVELSKKLRPRGLTLWAVNVDGDRFSNAVESFLATANLPFPVVYDRLKGDVLLAADPLSVTKTPTLILLDANRKVVLRQEVVIDTQAAEQVAFPK